jgi:hypothetical protein
MVEYATACATHLCIEKPLNDQALRIAYQGIRLEKCFKNWTIIISKNSERRTRF